LLVTAQVVHSSPIVSTLMMEVMLFSEATVPTGVKRRHIPEDMINNLSCKNLKPYIALTG
jgi:hypothetical protein